MISHAKLSYSALVTSLIAAVACIFLQATPRLDWYWWLGFGLFTLTTLTVLAPVFAYRRTTKPSRRYPVAPAFDYQAAIAVRDRTRRGPDSVVRARLEVAEELRRAA